MIMVIIYRQGNLSVFLCHTIAAYAEKIQSMIQDFKVSLNGDLFLHIFKTIQVRIDDLLALYADDVWMGVGLIPVISITPIRET